MILYHDNGNWPIFRSCFNESGVACHALLKYRFVSSTLLRIASFLGFGWKLTCKTALYYPKNGEHSLIVVFDTKIPDGYLQFLKAKNPSARIVIWCWNEIDPAGKLLETADDFDIWSYSPYDCKTYGLQYNPQFYFDSIVDRFAPIQPPAEPQGKKGFLFMGREKKRKGQIDEIANQIRSAGWECQIDYLQAPSAGDRKGHRTILAYDSVVQKTLDYQGILDVAAARESGLSLRVLEAAFFHKKLITTNPVVKQYDFYDESNIYVWGHSTMTLEEFLELPYRLVSREIMNRYLVSNWAARLQAAYATNANITDTAQSDHSIPSRMAADDSIICGIR